MPRVRGQHGKGGVMLNKFLAFVLLFLLIATTAQAGYKVEIGDVPAEPEGSTVDVPITIQWVGTGPPTDLEGFDINIAFEPHRLSLQGVARGSFLDDCGWASLSVADVGSEAYSGCCARLIDRQTQQIVAFANLPGIAASCLAPDPGEVAEIAVLTFTVTSLKRCGCDAEHSPIDFHWRHGDCTDNTFSIDDGNTLIGAQASYDFRGAPHTAGTSCSPPEGCAPGVVAAIDFHGGNVDLGAADPTDRGDINLDEFKYEISDAVVFSRYFTLGPSVFTIDPPRQVAATDVNCDGAPLLVADLVYMINVILCKNSPCTGDPPAPPSAPARVASTENTMGFYGASGRDGDRNVPFEFETNNTMILGGLLARVEFNPDYITPVPDPAAGGDQVKFELTSRSIDFGLDHAVAFARSPEPGVLVFGMWIIANVQPYPLIQPGSGPIIRVLFDVNLPEPPLSKFTPVQFVDEGYFFNQWSSELGDQTIIPALVNGEFEVLPVLPPPSCPVLYSYDGSEFVEQNTMLTACEQSDYVDVVTDYYHVAGLVEVDDGVVRFEFREGEDEITYLHDVRLLTIDHSRDTRVACTVDGQVFTYREAVAPLTAVDDRGNDRLASIVAEDGVLFVAEEPGHLVAEFPAGDGGIGINAISKERHLPPWDPGPPSALEGTMPPPTSLTVEYLDARGSWVAFPAVPPRDGDAHEFVYNEDLRRMQDNKVTIRVAWDGDYSTDVIRQFVPSDEQPITGEYRTRHARVQTTRTEGAGESAAFVLRKGDVLQFEFETPPVGSGLERDYIIVATGRYEPDYEVHPGMVPESFALHKNYPNPFNPATTITFSVPYQTDYTLQVYNIAGQVVASFAGTAEPGIARVDWNASGLASGVYVYRLTAGSYTDAQKMVLLK